MWIGVAVTKRQKKGDREPEREPAKKRPHLSLPITRSLGIKMTKLLR